MRKLILAIITVIGLSLSCGDDCDDSRYVDLDPIPTSIEVPDSYTCGDDDEGILLCHVSTSGQESQKCLYNYDDVLSHDAHKNDYRGWCTGQSDCID